MPSIFDVARYILDKKGDMTAMKLQKLCYYSQAWSLVWDEEPLFPEHFEAWIDGPVSPALYRKHRGRYTLSAEDIDGDPSNLDKEQRATINAVLKSYAKYGPRQLSELTHSEQPWKQARVGLIAIDRGAGQVISQRSMIDYYAEFRPLDGTTTAQIRR